MITFMGGEISAYDFISQDLLGSLLSGAQLAVPVDSLYRIDTNISMGITP